MEGQGEFSPQGNSSSKGNWKDRAALGAEIVGMGLRAAFASADDLAVPLMGAINPDTKPPIEAVTPSSYAAPTKEATNPQALNGNPPEQQVVAGQKEDLPVLIDTRTGEKFLHQLPPSFIHSFPKDS